MRHVLTVTVLLLLAGLPRFTPSARAGDPGPRHEADLQNRLQAALVWADVNQQRAEHLLRFAEELVGRLAEARAADSPSTEGLRAQVASLHEQVAALQANLLNEQQCHVEDVATLHQELAKANAKAESGRLRQVQSENAAVVARTELRIQKQELERLRWVYAREAPRESVAHVLSDIPGLHWRDELGADDEMRARVALHVLAVLPDPSADAVHAILLAASRHRSLLDAALRPLVRIGAPAVQPLVAAGCGEGTGPSLDRGWVMHVLGEIGPAAEDALPWLDEVAAGEGREAAQAQGAIRRIRAE
jgi:hypothetical protein